MSAAADDLYVTDAARTPRCPLDGQAGRYAREELEPIDWTTMLPERPPRSGVRRTGETDLNWEEETCRR